jgi:hypothetical protein
MKSFALALALAGSLLYNGKQHIEGIRLKAEWNEYQQYVDLQGLMEEQNLTIDQRGAITELLYSKNPLGCTTDTDCMVKFGGTGDPEPVAVVRQ